MPVHPADADVDENINRARQHRPQGPFFAYDDAKWFRDMVKPGATWDYKRLDGKYEDFGNFNYGARGTAIGFGLVTLLSEAGRVPAMPPGMKEKAKEWGYPAYDSLSRMTSETRAFTGLGNFTISYQHNLANQLSSITNPFNNTINYSRDTAGRLTSVTGTTFGTHVPVSTYASNMQYRAWGAIKSLNSGDNRTLTAGFNSRLQASEFTVSGLISKTYDYYADGKLRFSSDLLDHRFDRSYGFDQVGRLTSAFSGAEARGEGATTNRPYKQTYGYDALSHLTARTNEIWWTSINSISDSYVNNRHLPQGSSWQYDADGRLLSSLNDFYTYDAAGLTTHIEVPSTFSSHTSVGYDGDGRQVKTEDTTWNEDLQADVTETKHYLRSSVLGGKVLTEIFGTNSGRTFVYAGQAVIAWQWRSFGSESVEWDHKDPSGASVRRGGSGQELDPLGGDAGISAQTEIPDPGPLLSYGSSYSAANPNTTYTVDGLRVTSDDFMRRIDAPYQESIAWVEVAARSSVKKLHSFGVVNYNDELGLHYRHLGSNEQRAIAEALELNGILIINWLVSDTGSVSSLLSRLPQNTQVSENLRNFRAAVAAASQILSGDNECSRFFRGAGLGALNTIADAVNSAGDNAFQGFGDASTGIRMEVPRMVNSQDAPIVSADAYAAVRPSSVAINTDGPFVRSVAVGNATLPRFGGYNPGSLESRVLQLLHEAGHLTITDVNTTLRGIRVGNQTRFYRQSRLTHLLPIDGGNAGLSAQNTARILAACRDQINALANRR